MKRRKEREEGETRWWGTEEKRGGQSDGMMREESVIIVQGTGWDKNANVNTRIAESKCQKTGSRKSLGRIRWKTLTKPSPGWGFEFETSPSPSWGLIGAYVVLAGIFRFRVPWLVR